MAEGRLTVEGPGRAWQVPLGPQNMLIGRDRACDLVLRSGLVSRRHARLFRDPFGRWIVEDLGSRQGVFIKGERVSAAVVALGEPIRITPFVLTLAEPPAGNIPADPRVSTTTVVTEDAGEADVGFAESATEAVLSVDHLGELNRIGDALTALTDARQLYPEVCRRLAAAPTTAALVLRLGEEKASPAASPQVLAAHVLDRRGKPAVGPINLHLSRGVLDAARCGQAAVMGRSRTCKEDALRLTLADGDLPRAVIAAPVSEPGETVDTLYVDMPEQRATPQVFEFVRAVSRQVRFVRRSLLLAEARAERQAVDYQLRMAREIQLRLTPSKAPRVPGVDVAFSSRPALWVGGDYCDFWLLSDGRLAFAVGDVSGNGLPAAMVMANLQAVLRTTTDLCGDPDAAMRRVNAHLARHLPMGMFVTLFLGLYDPSQGRLEYINAGHIPPLRIGPGRRTARLPRPRNMVLGIKEEPFAIETACLQPDTGLLVVTDGVTDAESPEGKQFGLEGVAAAVRSGSAWTGSRLVQAITDAADRFRGSCPMQDDLTVFVLRRAGSPGRTRG